MNLLLFSWPLVLRLALPDCSGAPLNLGFSARLIDSDVPFEGIAGSPGEAEEIVVKTPPGSRPRARVFVDIISQLPEGSKIQGWALPIAITGDTVVLEATIRGTPGEPVAFRARFEGVTPIDPARNGGQEGLIALLLSSFMPSPFLPPVGTRSVLSITLEGSRPQGRDDEVVELRIQDGLSGAGQPVQSNLVVSGTSQPACNSGSAGVRIRLTAAPTFVRGNANDDSRVDLADPVWILNRLFGEGPAASCPEAADANGDGRVDISDPASLIAFLFTGGPPPLPPYPACGLDPDASGGDEMCEAGQPSCR